MTDNIKNQTKTVVKGLKTPGFWLKGTISALIGGGFGSISSVFGLLAADLTGADIGDSLNLHTLGAIFAVGSIAKASHFLKYFKLDGWTGKRILLIT